MDGWMDRVIKKYKMVTFFETQRTEQYVIDD